VTDKPQSGHFESFGSQHAIVGLHGNLRGAI
jgi:hypothetical protein